MNLLRPSVAVALGLGLLLASCGKRESASAGRDHEGEPHPENPVRFEEGKGLLLSRENLHTMKVGLAEVVERPLAETFTATAQVYRGADEASAVNGRYRRQYAYASAAISAALAGRVKEDAQVTIQRPPHAVEDKDHPPGRPLGARLIGLDASLQTASQTIEALLEIPDAECALPVGAFVSATFQLGQPQVASVIPASGLLRTAQGTFVYVQNGRHLLRTPVETGPADTNWVTIRDGLLPGDLIATNGVESLWLVELQAVKGGRACH